MTTLEFGTLFQFKFCNLNAFQLLKPAHFTKNTARIIFSVLFAIMFGFLYVILQSEDYALLLGSTGLFLLLGTIMFLTRKINWYKGSAAASEEL